MEDHIQFDIAEHALLLLDQRLLPNQESHVACRNVGDIVTALKTMVVRGAPAIGVTAAWGCVLALQDILDRKVEDDWRAAFNAELDRIAQARPTAVNLRWAVERMRAVAQAFQGSAAELLPRLEKEARTIHQEDIAICKALGRAGADCIPDNSTVLTHCNAGALATAGYGTALGVIRAAREQGKKVRVIADETRPFLQGARLTAWELKEDGIDVTVACDNACALLMQKGMVDCVVVGADRIAANGDSANKIGTFGVAILAQHFGIPFYIAAPLSTIDPATPTGAGIPIEERPYDEVATLNNLRICPEDVPAYNFAFDVTPAHLITGIITEQGVLRQPYKESIAAAFAKANSR